MTARAYRLPDGDWVCELNAMAVYKGAANKADDMAKGVNFCIARGCQFVARRFSKKPSDKKAWHVIPTHEVYGDGDVIKSFGNSGNKADDWAADLNAAVERGRAQHVSMPAVPVPAFEDNIRTVLNNAPTGENLSAENMLGSEAEMGGVHAMSSPHDMSGTGLPVDQ